MIDYSTMKHTADGMPTWDSFLPILLQTAAQQDQWKSGELKRATLNQVNLPQDMRELKYDNGTNVALSRISFALSDLKVAGLLESPTRSLYQITDLGKQLLNTYGLDLNKMVVHQLPQYAKHQDKVLSQRGRRKPVQPTEPDEETVKTTEDSVADWFDLQKEQTKDELLTRMQKINHYRFEALMVRLFTAMGYKGDNGEAMVTQRSHDKGIDGMISQDPLGLQKVYIQVKHYSPSDIVQQKTVMEFSGAMQVKHANRGVLVTTSSFSSGAKEMAQNLGVILVDGDQLTDLMIEYRAGVNVRQSYELYDLDADFFTPYEDENQDDPAD